jgi:hypothetical protein
MKPASASRTWLNNSEAEHIIPKGEPMNQPLPGNDERFQPRDFGQPPTTSP